MIERAVGDLDEVLNNLGVFSVFPDELIAPCPSGFRRVPITQGGGFYISLQGFAPNQTAYAHTHGDSEEWVIVLKGSGEALISEHPVPLSPGVVVARATGHPHGFLTTDDSMHLLSIQLPRPVETFTTWDEVGETTDPITCQFGGRCRRCHRCGGHSRELPAGAYGCENCRLEF